MASTENEPTLSDKPLPSANSIGYASDVMVEQLSRLGLRYMAVVPGSSYRGLHDSLVNYGSNISPEMLVTLHEEHAVAIAHGYAKVTRKPMVSRQCALGPVRPLTLHFCRRLDCMPTLVRLETHAGTKLVDNPDLCQQDSCTRRWRYSTPSQVRNESSTCARILLTRCDIDRVPMLILGATGPLDATKRRPWIDWLHTATDQAAIIRQYIKWDDQPHSANAAAASLAHGYVSTASKPCAPVYICMDLGLQESSVDPKDIQFPETERLLQIRIPGPSADDVADVLAALEDARRPLLMLGRMSVSKSSWDERIQLAERFGANVITDLKQVSAFPTEHRLHAAAPSIFVTPQMQELIREADLILSADWIDLDGAIKASYAPGSRVAAKVIHISLDSAVHNGWSKDHFGLPPADITVHADPDRAFATLLAASDDQQTTSEWPRERDGPAAGGGPSRSSAEDIYMSDLARTMYDVLYPDEMCLVRVPLGWKGVDLRATHPLSFMVSSSGTLAFDGGARLTRVPSSAGHGWRRRYWQWQRPACRDITGIERDRIDAVACGSPR